MNKRYFPILLFVLLHINAMAILEENEKIDSLYDITWEYLFIDTDTAILYSEELLDLSLKENSKLGVIKSYYALGYAHYLQNHLDTALSNYLKGIEIIRKGNLNSEVYVKRKMYLLQNIGLIYELIEEHNEAIDFSTEALRIAESLGITIDIASLNYNIGVNYYHLENYDEAELYFEKALKLYEDLEYKKDKVKTLNVIGNLHMKKLNFSRAKSYFNSAIFLCNKYDILHNKKAWYISNIGEVYFIQKKYDSAIFYYNKALQLSLELNDRDKEKWLYNNIGDAFYHQKDFHTAINYYQLALGISVANPKIIDEEYQRACEMIAMAYKQTGQYQKALKYKDQFFSQFKTGIELKERLQKMNHIYENESHEERKLQHKKESFLWFVIILSALLLIIIISMIRAYNTIQESKQ